MKCTKDLHVFEHSENHPYNQMGNIGGNCRGFPYWHFCKCNTKQMWPPELTEEIQKGSMIDKILISRIESFKNNIIPNDTPIDWEWKNQKTYFNMSPKKKQKYDTDINRQKDKDEKKIEQKTKET